MTATEQSSKEQPPVTGSSTASSMDVDNSSTKTDTEKSLPSTDDMRAKPSEAIELPSDDEFGDDVPVFDESDVLDGRTDSLLTSIKSEMSKQGIEIRGGDSQAGNTAVEGLLSIVNGASSESLEQQEGNVTNSEDVEEEKLPLEESFSLKELIDMMKEESLKKIDEPEDKSTKRFEQLTKIIDEIQSLEKGRESTTVKIHLAVKIEAIQSASSTNSAIKCWKELIEDLDLDLKTRKSKAQKRIADKEKIQELKKLKQPIPRELTKKGHAKIMAEVAQAQKEIKTLRKKVSKLESKELSLADMDKEDNAFLKVGQLSKRINFLVKKVARLQGCTINYRRSIYQPIKYEESKYDDINEAISKEVTKLIKEKRLDPNTKLKGMAPDFKDIDDIVRNTGTGKLMKEGEIHAESQTIFKSIIDELRTRRQQELSEFFDQYESDEELSKTDVHETNDEELEKKLISLDEAREKIDKVVKEFVSKVELMTPEDLAKDEAEALKEEEEEEKAAAEMVIFNLKFKLNLILCPLTGRK